MAAVHGPTLAQHPTSFQAHNIPVSRMGFHPAPPPVVSISYLSFSSSPLAHIFSSLQRFPRHSLLDQIPTTVTNTQPSSVVVLSHISSHVPSYPRHPRAQQPNSRILSPTPSIERSSTAPSLSLPWFSCNGSKPASLPPAAPQDIVSLSLPS